MLSDMHLYPSFQMTGSRFRAFFGASSKQMASVVEHKDVLVPPMLERFFFSFEKEFHGEAYFDFARKTWPTVPVAACVLYFLMITIGTRVMKDRKPFDWKPALAAWNFLLCTFSFLGMLRTMPHLIVNLTTFSHIDTFCKPAETMYANGPCGFWVMLFIFSKVPELVDTGFIVFRKSKLIFLHWYHHITVLLFCWHSYATQSSTGLWFVAMNYAVHALMYGYYFLMTIKRVPKWFRPEVITIAQIAQMVVGTYVCVASYIYLRSGVECAVRTENVLAGGLMYSSYLYLFTEFFVKRFILKTSVKPSKKVQ